MNKEQIMDFINSNKSGTIVPWKTYDWIFRYLIKEIERLDSEIKSGIKVGWKES